jgi:hypothetical protein
MEHIPKGEVPSGSPVEADNDTQHTSVWLHDFAARGDELDEALRPVYIDHVEHHPEPDKG